MYLKMGNLGPADFARRVGSEFTDDELEYLRGVWSQKAELTGPEDFHIFDSPAISIHIGSATGRVVEIFKAADARKSFNQPIQFYLDEGWKAV